MKAIRAGPVLAFLMSAPSALSAQADPDLGRYQIVMQEDGLAILWDTQTGRAWVANPSVTAPERPLDRLWKPIDFAPGAPSAPPAPQ